jgi:hypothetical protein
MMRPSDDPFRLPPRPSNYSPYWLPGRPENSGTATFGFGDASALGVRTPAAYQSITKDFVSQVNGSKKTKY